MRDNSVAHPTNQFAVSRILPAELDYPHSTHAGFGIIRSMHRRRFASSVIIVIALATLVVYGMWYYEGNRSKPTDIAYPQRRSSADNASNTSSSLVSYASSTETYTDPSGTFSFQYPTDFTLSSDTVADYLPATLIEAQPPVSRAE